MIRIGYIVVCIVFFSIGGWAQQKKAAVVPPVSLSKEGNLVYQADSVGNRVIDFSYCGYKGGDERIPEVPVTVRVPWVEGDATGLIQQAIDQLAARKPDPSGFRGAVLLAPGTYRIEGQLKITTSGVVLRGSGVLEGGTRLQAAGKDRRTLIRVSGVDNRVVQDTVPIRNTYLPVNARSLEIKDNPGLKPGDRILIHRSSTNAWIDAIGTRHFGGGITSLGWKAGEQDLYWDREILSVEGHTLTIDAPLTMALDSRYAELAVLPYRWEGRIERVGIENLQLESDYDRQNPLDEEHAWMGITFDCVRDAWVRDLSFRHFAGSAVMVNETSSRITVERCKSLQPVSEIGGQRRYTFFTAGQQCLFRLLYAESGYHDFGTGFCAPGPNAFVQCHSSLPYSFSGTIDSWSPGVLFDIVHVDGQALSFKNRGQDAQGAGWTTAHSVFWQCSASKIECYSPPMAMNYAFGSWAEFQGDGAWFDSNNHIRPRSLYEAQLKERLGDRYIDRNDLLPVDSEASSSPKVEVALALTQAAVYPALTLDRWIDSLFVRNPIPTEPGQANWLNANLSKQDNHLPTVSALSLKNGWIVRDNKIQVGKKHDIQWWNGTVQPAYIRKTARPHITRFVPGRTGTGWTDEINEVASWMKANHILSLDHHYGLWYDRRRDDHERIRRIDGEVWPPFFEQPFARSGQGKAFDGLSKYDLTRYNHWYWMRLRQFAEEADRHELILLNQHYFQHNIIEAGAHWTDSPWRPANNINETGFPEPAPYAGDKRIFLAEQFYDIGHPVRRELHRAYIRQCLANFKETGSVIHLVSDEYTGPLHFVEFWLDVIAAWQAEEGKHSLVALSATKDVQDAILADPLRSALVDVIDIRYWFQREDGSTYAPQGGLSLAPRQHARLVKPGKVSFRSVYRMVSEYRKRFPGKAVMYHAADYPRYAWAVLMAGGSLANIPELEDDQVLSEISSMQVLEHHNTDTQYVLGTEGKSYLIYSETGNIELDLSAVKGKLNIRLFDLETGKNAGKSSRITAGKRISLNGNKGKLIFLSEK